MKRLSIAAATVGLGLLGVVTFRSGPLMASADNAVFHIANTPDVANIRSGASLSASVVDHYRNGLPVSIVCQASGDNYRGTSIWDNLGNGRWVSDYLIDNTPYAQFDRRLRQCGGGGGGGSPDAKVAAAIAFEQSQVGSANWEWLCDGLVARAYGYRGSGEGTAFEHYQDLSGRGLIHRDRNIPTGAMVFFGPNDGNGKAGHVMMNVGGDQYISNAIHGRVGYTTLENVERWSPYLGWAYGGASGFPKGW
jgi:hypothetical protein